MPYPWECFDCDEYYEDLVKNGKFYCNKMHRYVLVKEPSCNTYFVKRDKNRPLRSPSNGCYITTAVVDVLGYEDDCEVLETLRAFRDNYMKKEEKYLPLLEDYNTVGRIISHKLEKDENKEKIANMMYNIFIKSSIDAIKDREYSCAIGIYENMVYFLMDYYELDMDLLHNKKESIQRKREIR